MKAERQIDLLQYINEKGTVSTKELMDYFKISRATLNRDLTELESEKLITKVHGGVISKAEFQTFEPSISKKEMSKRAEKEAIAKKAITCIHDDQTIILDSGSTIWYLANELVSQTYTNLTVITCDLKIAYTLAKNDTISLFVLGGMKQKGAYDLILPTNLEMLNAFNVDVYFMACSAFDAEQGLTHFNQLDYYLKTAMLKVSNKHILCSDSSKYGISKRWKLCELNDLDMIITDNKLDTTYQNMVLQKNNCLEIVSLK